jgi:hypothetical protein
MAGFYDAEGKLHKVEIDAGIYKAAYDANLSVPHYINKTYLDADPKVGSAFDQLCASEGLALPGKNPYGLRSATVAEVLDGTSGLLGVGGNSNSKDQGSPFGNASRILFPAAIVTLIEATNRKDYATDSIVFGDMVASEMSVPTENFIQPVINYDTVGGPTQAKAQRISQFAEAPNLIRFGTSERNRSLPTYGIGMEFSQQALRATTLDLVALTLNRYLMVEKDGRVYQYLSSIFSGDSDMNTGAVSAVTTTSLDATATGGVVVKFLARKRKFRKITHVIGDIDSYLKVESRTGRPGTTAYDPTLARIDPQAKTMNDTFGGDVKWFIVDDAASGGPVPASTIWALDATKGIVRVSNTSASYTAAEQFVLRRTEAMVVHWSEDVYRMFGDADLSPFDILTIA